MIVGQEEVLEQIMIGLFVLSAALVGAQRLEIRRGLAIEHQVAEIDKACREVVRANKLTDGYVRPIAWRGPGCSDGTMSA